MKKAWLWILGIVLALWLYLKYQASQAAPAINTSGDTSGNPLSNLGNVLSALPASFQSALQNPSGALGTVENLVGLGSAQGGSTIPFASAGQGLGNLLGGSLSSGNSSGNALTTGTSLGGDDLSGGDDELSSDDLAASNDISDEEDSDGPDNIDTDDEVNYNDVSSDEDFESFSS